MHKNRNTINTESFSSQSNFSSLHTTPKHIQVEPACNTTLVHDSFGNGNSRKTKQHTARHISSSRNCVKKTVRFNIPNSDGEDVSNKTPETGQEKGKKKNKRKSLCFQQKSVEASDSVDNLSASIANNVANWKSRCIRWVARIEHLTEMKLNSVKALIPKTPFNGSVYYCDNQRHLLIGNGPDFSTVYVGIASDGTEVAVKKINIKRAPSLLNSDTANLLLSLPDHPYISKTYFISRDKTHFYVVKELSDFSLKEELKRCHFVPKSVRKPWPASRICLALSQSIDFLHSHNMLHMAIKPENVMVDSRSQKFVLTDFGVHNRLDTKQAKEGSSSHCWLPNEILKYQEMKSNHCQELGKYTRATDIASLGMLFYYIITEGGHPFGDHDNAPANCVKNILHGTYNLKALNDPFAHHMVKNMICKEAGKRYTISQVLAHPYFWSETERNQYLRLLAKSALAIYDLQDIIESEIPKEYDDFLGVIRSQESEILGAYVQIEDLKEIPEHFHADLHSLFTFMNDSMERSQRCCFNERDVTCYMNDPKDFWMCFPGLLLFTFMELPLRKLHQITTDLKLEGLHDKNTGMLQSLCSVDSGLESPKDFEASFPSVGLCKIGTDTIPVPERKTIETFNHTSSIDSSSTFADDGIDILTPLSGSLTDGGVFFPSANRTFSSPIQFKESTVLTEGQHAHKVLSPGSFGSTVDSYFEFDKGDYMSEITTNVCHLGENMPKVLENMHLWTDIDELD